jgi:sirohydrochlorin cobaltochelatase
MEVKMIEQGILVVSFGTSYKEAEEKSICNVESTIRDKFKPIPVYRAYTSGIVRKIIAKRCEIVDSTNEALIRMKNDGINDVFVLPTHLIYGEEYDKIKSIVQEEKENFKSITLGKPLLGDLDDMKRIAHILNTEYSLTEDECLVLMGHGTKHFANMVYPAMEYICHEQGYKNMYVGTIESYPDIDIVLQKIKNAGKKKATLIPFMFVAGDHAVNDMAGEEEDSWVSRFRKEGIETKVVIKGLGEYEEIRELYCEHINLSKFAIVKN